MINKIINIQTNSSNKSILKKKSPQSNPSFTCDISMSTNRMELKQAIKLVRAKFKESCSVLQGIEPFNDLRNVFLVLDYESEKPIELLVRHMGLNNMHMQGEIPLSIGSREVVDHALQSEYLEQRIRNILNEESDKLNKFTNDAI